MASLPDITAANVTATNWPPQGVICLADEYLRSLRDPSIHCLTRAESIGLTVSELFVVSCSFLHFYAFGYNRSERKQECSLYWPFYMSSFLSWYATAMITRQTTLNLLQRNVIWRCRHMKKDRLQVFHQPMDLLMVHDLTFYAQ